MVPALEMDIVNEKVIDYQEKSIFVKRKVQNWLIIDDQSIVPTLQTPTTIYFMTYIL